MADCLLDTYCVCLESRTNHQTLAAPEGCNNSNKHNILRKWPRGYKSLKAVTHRASAQCTAVSSHILTWYGTCVTSIHAFRDIVGYPPEMCHHTPCHYTNLVGLIMRQAMQRKPSYSMTEAPDYREWRSYHCAHKTSTRCLLELRLGYLWDATHSSMFVAGQIYGEGSLSKACITSQAVSQVAIRWLLRHMRRFTSCKGLRQNCKAKNL